MIKEAIEKIVEGQDLTFDEAKEVMNEIMSGETPDTLSEGVLYEVHMTVEDGGDFDLSETEKEIKISAVLGA